MPRYFLQLSFNGTQYRGWQVQPDRPSVQAELEKALRLKLRDPSLGIVGCGRTDSGVHATQYFAHFEHEENALDDRLVHGLNSLLPADIAVQHLIPVTYDAHARFSATERGYVYRINTMKDPFLVDRSFQLRPALRVEAMNMACEALVGKHDFSSFCRVGSDNRTMVCDVRSAKWEQRQNGYVFRIRSDRYLRNMVRAIVGTCIRIGKGQWTPERMTEIRDAKDRGVAGKSAPARGLYLEYVRYPFIHDMDLV